MLVVLKHEECYYIPIYVEAVPNRNSPPAILLREGWREGGRVRKRTLANLSDWPPAQVDRLRRVLKGELLVSLEEALRLSRSLLALSNPVLQVSAVHVLDDEQQEIVERLGVMAIGNVGMESQIGSGFRFTCDAMPVLWVGKDLGAGYLHRHVHVPLRLPGQPDLAHTASAEQSLDLEVAGNLVALFDGGSGRLHDGWGGIFSDP